MSSPREGIIDQYILNPTAKNKRILRTIFMIYLAVDLILGIFLWYTAVSIKRKTTLTLLAKFCSKCIKFAFILRAGMIVFGLFGVSSHRPSVWSICGTCCLATYIFSFLSEISLIVLSVGKTFNVVIITIQFVLGILTTILAIILIILLNYQDLMTSDEKKAKLEFRDSDRMMERNFTRSILHLIPGIGLFTNLISSWTKED